MPPVHEPRQFPHRWTTEIWDDRNLGAIDDLVADDFVGRSPGLPEPLRGPEDVREFVGMLHAACPDLAVEVEDVIAAGDRVAVRHAISGTHEGPLFGVPATGEAFDVAHVSFMRVEEGRLTEEWELGDHMGLFEQVGVVESPIG